jgi:hypothetical protein
MAVATSWPRLREAVVNRSIGRIDRLRAILRGRLACLARDPAIVRPVVGFHRPRRPERWRIREIRWDNLITFGLDRRALVG